MHRGIAWLLFVGLVSCNVGEREVKPPGVADGAVDTLLAPDRGAGRDVHAKTTPPATTDRKDTTTCVFMGGGYGNCYVATGSSSPLAFECSGSGSCSVDVTAPKGTELTWKSSCGGYAYSVVDGVPDTVGFICPGSADPMEKVTCLFQSSTDKQACTTGGLPGPFRCSGVGSCEVWVLTKTGTPLSWTSTCGGSYHTVVGDGGGTLTFSCH